MTGLAERGLKPVRQLAQRRPHGDRLRYLGGCKCFDCRRANTAYEAERKRARDAGDWNGIVDAGPARKHLKYLSSRGVGRRAVADASDVAATVIYQIRSGAKRRIRARTEKRILAVTVKQRSDRALISARTTWKQIRELLGEDFTAAQIATALGYKNRALQFGKERITVRNAAAVDRLWRKYMTEAGL